MCDDPSNKLSTAEKLDLLITHATAWQNLDSARPDKVDILVGCNVPLAVSCNIIVFSKDIIQGVSGWDDAPIGDPEPLLGLLVLRVPSPLRGIDAAHWMLTLPPDVSSGCIRVDASQDLLIYPSYVLFLISPISSSEKVTKFIRIHVGHFFFFWCD
jgi:hypothetical protein